MPALLPSDRTPNVGDCRLYDSKVLGTDKPDHLCLVKCCELINDSSDLWGMHPVQPVSPRVLPPSKLPRHEGGKFATPWYGDCTWAVGMIAAIGTAILSFAPIASAAETYTPPDNGGPTSTQGCGTRNTPALPQTEQSTLYRGSGR